MWWYLCTPLEELPFIHYAIMSYTGHRYHMYFPEHTAHGYLAEFGKYIQDHGGDIWFNTEVTEIMVEKGRVKGVKTNRGDVVLCGNVVSDIALGNIYRKLINPQSEVKASALKRLNSIPDNHSFFMVYLGLDASPEELGMKYLHQFINMTNDYHRTFDAAMTLDPPYAMGGLCPNVTVKNASPEGTCILTITVCISADAFAGMSQKEYFKAKEELAERIVSEYEKLSGYDIKSHIEEACIATPATLARYAGLPGGALGRSLRLINHPIVQSMVKGAEEYIHGLTMIGQFSLWEGYANNPMGAAAGWKLYIAQIV